MCRRNAFHSSGPTTEKAPPPHPLSFLQLALRGEEYENKTSDRPWEWCERLKRRRKDPHVQTLQTNRSI